MNVREAVSEWHARALALAGLLTFLGVWAVLSYADFVPSVILPSPTEVLKAFPVLHFQEALVRSAGWSLYRVTMGFVLATLVAIPLGILAGRREYDLWQVNEDAEYHEAGERGASRRIPRHGLGASRRTA